MMQLVAVQQGKVLLAQKEKPALLPGHLLVKVEYSAISPGTEMIFLRRQTEDLHEIGYSAVGIIEAIGEGTEGYVIGERVACYGAPYVKHAQWIAVPSNLTTKVPDTVDPKEAAFAGLGAIAIHALRVADIKFGESVAVVGLGILGNIIAQIAQSAGYRVIGYDLDAYRAQMLHDRGVSRMYASQQEMEAHLAEVADTAGVDAVILCASGNGEALINSSLSWIRLRGKVVIVGDLSLQYSRELMFGKEAQLLISRAGGPGRYDPQYERHNIDYPIGYVRWTEGRNVAEFIRLLAEQRITIKDLITHTYPLERVEEAYDNYRDSAKVKHTIGTLIQFM